MCLFSCISLHIDSPRVHKMSLSFKAVGATQYLCQWVNLFFFIPFLGMCVFSRFSVLLRLGKLSAPAAANSESSCVRESFLFLLFNQRVQIALVGRSAGRSMFMRSWRCRLWSTWLYGSRSLNVNQSCNNLKTLSVT